MKRLKFSVLALILVTMIFSSCAKPVTHTCSVEKVYFMGDLVYRFTYSNGKVAEIEQINPDGTMSEYHILTRNAQGLLFHMDWIEFGLLLERKVCLYNGNNDPSTMYSLNDANNDGYPEQINHFYKFIYNSENKLTEVRHYNSTSTYTGSETFVWTGDNLTRYNTIAGDYYLYSYDDKKSIYSSLKWEHYILQESPNILSSGNLVHAEHYDAGNNLLSSDDNTYTYDPDGYPESGVIQTYDYTFEYNCVEN
jgi:hypothetical protein